MRNLNYLNHRRIDEKSFFGVDGDEHNGAFRIKINNESFFVVASNQGGWEHISISHKQRTPTWEEMCKTKDMFFKEDEVVMQIHPKKIDYVDNHKYCLHLWKPIDKEIPIPPKFMV